MEENKKYTIDELLSICPSNIAREAQKAEESRFLWKEAEARLKQVEAKLYLELKSDKPDSKIEDLKNKVNSDDGIYEQRLAVIAHESEYKKNMIQVERFSNLFVTARKKAELRICEMKCLNQTVGRKYGEAQDREDLQEQEG